MTIDTGLTEAMRTAVTAMGFSAAMAACIEVETLPGWNDDVQCKVTWGHQAMRRGQMGRREVGMSVFGLDQFEDRIHDQDGIADMFVAVRQMLPADIRDEPLPAWAEGRGDRIRDALDHAGRLSAAGVKGATIRAA